MSRGWICVLSTCLGRLTVTSTVGAVVEGVWRIPGVRCTCCRSAYTITKHRTRLTSTAPRG